MRFSPHLVYADEQGNIYDDPDLLLVASRGGEWFVPNMNELVPLPQESQTFLLPGRRAVGFNPRANKIEELDNLAVAAFVAPGYTLSAHPAYTREENAPLLPLFAYGAVGYAKGRFWVCAAKVDEDPRQIFSGISPKKIEKNCQQLLKAHPQNRLVSHIINNCVRKYSCPAAKNFALGRYEAPLPTSRSCNASCHGCISAKNGASPLAATPQCRLEFTPTAHEIAEVMHIHELREKERPIYSFGQGCEGDPLMNPRLLAASIENFRKLAQKGEGGAGTINCNTNASRPEAVRLLCEAGLTSMRVSLNSARPELYEAYYRPADYNFSHVIQSIRAARGLGVFVALNLLYFPGITDTPAELDALARLCTENGVSMIQWRNLNIDPLWYPGLLGPAAANQPAMGLANFMKSLKKMCPWLRYGYFNPWLDSRAELAAPKPA